MGWENLIFFHFQQWNDSGILLQGKPHVGNIVTLCMENLLIINQLPNFHFSS